MATAKPRRRNRKKGYTKDGRKILYKAQGFQCFVPNAKPVPKNRKSKRVACEPVVEPETGIHSLAWASAIKAQESGFLKLPLEIRIKIYSLVIANWSLGREPIEPRKNGMKFKSLTWPRAAEETASLYLLCRQTYVDVVGTGLLYSTKLFHFPSPNLLLNYLWVIHPTHLSALRSIELRITYSPSLVLSHAGIAFLASCTGLKNLFIGILVNSWHCRRSFGRHYNWVHAKYALPERLMAKLANWTAIKQLRGLRTFRLSVDWSWVKPDEAEESNALIRDIENDIRAVVLEKGTRDEWSKDEIRDVLRMRYGHAEGGTC